MRRLYLHVGIHKTGTTSIQSYLRENEGVLVSKGYLYPFSGAKHSTITERARKGTLSIPQLVRDLNAEIRTKGRHIHSIILSDEQMSSLMDIRKLGPLKNQFDVKVVVALRRQDLWIESWYLQNLKWQADPKTAHLEFAEFCGQRKKFHWIDFDARLAKYRRVFGEECVIASVFEREAMPNGPIDAFLEQIGLTDLTDFGPRKHSNVSLSPRVAEFMRHLPLDQLVVADRRRFEAAAGVLDRNLEKEASKLIMPHGLRMEILDEFAESNARVAARYFGRDSLFSAPVPGPDAPLATMALPDSSKELLRDFVAPFVVALGEVMRGPRLPAAKEEGDPKGAPAAGDAGQEPAVKAGKAAPKPAGRAAPVAAKQAGADVGRGKGKAGAKEAVGKAGGGKPGDGKIVGGKAGGGKTGEGKKPQGPKKAAALPRI